MTPYVRRFKLKTRDAANPESAGVVAEAVTRLANPAGLTATAGKNQIFLRWQPVASSYVREYRVYRLQGDQPLTEVSGLAPVHTLTSTTWTDTGLINGLPYQYAVTVVNASGVEDASVAGVQGIPRQDADGPVIGVFSPAAGQVVTAPLTMEASATDAESTMAEVELHIDGVLVASGVGSSVSYYWNVVDSTDGNHAVKVAAYDEHGNRTEIERTVTVSLAAPAIPTIEQPSPGAILDTNTVTVSGTKPAHATVTLQVNGVVVGESAAEDLAGEIFSIPSVSLVEGTNILAVQASHRGGTSPFSAGVRVVVDSGAPPAPVNLTAKALAGGAIQFGWQAGAGEVPTGFNLYVSADPFESITDPGVGKVNANPLPYPFHEILSVDAAPFHYAVTALDGAGNESGLSNVVLVAADGSAPQVQSVTFAYNGGPEQTGLTAGPGTVTAAVAVSEALSAAPFFSIEPPSSSPIVVALTKVDDLHYTGSFQITETTPHGQSTYKYSTKDLIGNRGSGQGAGPFIDVRGPQMTVVSPVTLARIVEQPVTVAFAFDEATVGTPLIELVDAGSQAVPVIGLTQGVDARSWTGSVNLSGLAEGTAVFRLLGARDVLGNLGTSVTGGEKIQLYLDAPPAPPAPDELTATAGKGGEIALAWAAASDAQGYRIYRKGEAEVDYALLKTVTGTRYVDLPAEDGLYSYAVSALGLLETEGARSAEVQAGSDRTAPSAPTGLALTLDASGVKAAWSGVQVAGSTAVEVPETYRLYRAAAPIGDVSGLSAVATSIVLEALDAAPNSGERHYAVTALDALGNESAPSASVEIDFPVAPVAELVLTQIEGGKPAITWSSTEAGLRGYYIYRNGRRINDSPTPSTSFQDGYYSGGAAAYGVTAVDAYDNESPQKEVTLTPLEIGLPEGTVLRRGLLETVPVVLSAAEPLEVSAVKIKVGSASQSTLSQTLTLAPSGSDPGTYVGELRKVAGTPLDAPAEVAVVCTAVLKPAPGVRLEITRTSQARVGGAGAALEIFNESLVRGTQGQVRLKVNNLGSAPMEFLTSENGKATSQVRILLRDQDGNLLAEGRLNQRTGSQVVNAAGFASARIEPGASFLSEPITFKVPESAPNAVVLEAVIAGTYYHYGWPDQVSAPGLKQAVPSTIAEVSYAALAQTDKAVYHQGESVQITGQAISSATGDFMVHVPVRIGVSVKGFDRFYAVETDENGNFSYNFTPSATEAGSYSVWAMHPDLRDRTVQASFDIIGLAVSPNIFNLTLTRGQSYDIPVTLTNLGGAELSGLTFASEASTGLSTTVANSGDDKLTGGESQKVNFHISSTADAPPVGYARLSVGTADGLSDQVAVNVSLLSAIPIIKVDRSYIDTGLVRGSQKIETFTITNAGKAPLANARLEGPSIPWLTLTISPELGDVVVGQSVPVGVLIRPGADVPPGVYDDRIVIVSDNHIPYTFNIQATVTSDAVGSVYFDVQNELYEKLSGAALTVQHQALYELRYNLKTNENGTVMLSDIPEGRYSFNVTASGHLPYSGSFTVEPGLTRTVPVALEVNMVSIEWSVTETTIQDKYEIRVAQTFETNVPTPVLIAEPAGITLPPMQPGEVLNGEFMVTNYGLIAVFDVEISFPGSFEDYEIEVMTEAVPERIEAMQTIVVPYRVTRRVQTASGGSLYEEVSGYGGGNCVNYISVSVAGTCIVCPDSPFERAVRKAVNWVLSWFKDCPEETSDSGGTWQRIEQGSGGGPGSQSGGDIGITQPTPIIIGNECECREEGDPCEEDGDSRTCDVCLNRECSHGGRIITGGGGQYAITTQPSMPNINFNSQLIRDTNPTLLEWEFVLTDNSHSQCQPVRKTGDGTMFSPNFGSTIMGGGFVATLKYKLGKCEKSSQPVSGRIVGTDPSKTEIIAEIGEDETAKKIACVESGMHHFRSDGSVVTGPTRDYGIMQIAYKPTCSNIWNWRDNISRGLSILNYSRNFAESIPERVRTKKFNGKGPFPDATDFTDEEKEKEAIQRYNTGTDEGNGYWDWDDDLKIWIEAKVNSYVDLVDSASCYN